MPIYLDHAATTSVLPEVKEAMLPFFDEKFGNPSSIHHYGRVVRTAMDEARQKLRRKSMLNPNRFFLLVGERKQIIWLYSVLRYE